MYVVHFDRDITRLLAKITNDMVKGLAEDRDEYAFLDELNVLFD